MKPTGLSASDNAPGSPSAGSGSADEASRKEIVFFSLSGAADGFVGGFVTSLGGMLMVVFKIDPLIVGLLMALVTVATVFADPVLAHLSDNARFKMGRRLPFMLVSGLLLGIILPLGVYFFPHSSKVELNTPLIPKDAVSEKALVAFGRMLTAYDVPKTKLLVAPINEVGGEPLPPALQNLFPRTVKTMNSPLSAVLSTTEDDAQGLAVALSIRGFKGRAVDTEPSAAAGTGFALSLAVGSEGKRVERQVSVAEASGAGREKRSLAQWISDVSRNESARVELHYTGDGVDGRNLHIARRGSYRAVVYASEIALIESLGERFKLPYWRVLPPGTAVDPSIKQRIREALPTDRAAYLPQLKALAYASGYSMDLKSADLSAAEKEYLAELSSSLKAGSERNLYLKLWEEADFNKGSGRLSLYHKPPGIMKKDDGIWRSITSGLRVWDKVSAEDRRIIIYMLLFFIVKFWVHSGFSAPAYALSLELAPTYHGRTRVITYKSFFGNCVALVTPWLGAICFFPLFENAVHGIFWLTLFGSILLIISVLLTVFNCKERTKIDRTTKKTALLRTIKEIGSSIHFWKLCAINLIVGNSLGIFSVVGLMIGTYYVFKGDLLMGAAYGAILSTLATLNALASIPVMNWICRRFEKHNALRFALSMMVVGCILKWWCYNPEHPEYQFIMPFFFSFGICGLMMVLGSMMGDVTDVDELECGTRREGMFGAVSALVQRWIGIFGTVAGGAMVSISGFSIEAGPDQAPGVFTLMRILFSFVPGILLCSCFLILWRYPLTEERMKQIKAETDRRHSEKLQVKP